jgi:hypothetical protein
MDAIYSYIYWVFLSHEIIHRNNRAAIFVTLPGLQSSFHVEGSQICDEEKLEMVKWRILYENTFFWEWPGKIFTLFYTLKYTSIPLVYFPLTWLIGSFIADVVGDIVQKVRPTAVAA